MNTRSLSHMLEQAGQASWFPRLQDRINLILDPQSHGDLPRWQQALDNLPSITPGRLDFNQPAVTIGQADDCSELQREQLREQLQLLHPWRKGPFELFGIFINTEWQSWMKWQRLQPHITSLDNRRVLDVGCGNGYYGWRMLGAGASSVVGLDPSRLFYMQHQAVSRYVDDVCHVMLPLAMEELPLPDVPFDTVFSMGVIYHRKDPVQHLQELRQQLRKDGELVLEGLVIEGSAGDVLYPESRYAKMRNVWSIPSPATMLQWLEASGFHNARCVDICMTSTEEQRATDWMRFESLDDFLDPVDNSRTIEGYPAPRRGIFIATA